MPAGEALHALAARPDTVRRILHGLIADDLGRWRRRSFGPQEYLCWDDSLPVNEDGLGFDSLARLDLVAALNRYFDLAATGIEDYLLVRHELGEWRDLICRHLRMQAGAPDPRITFATSGSTGTPKQVPRPVATLAREARELAQLLAPQGRVLSLVPAQHIYGFLLTALMPALAGVEVIDLRGRAIGALGAVARPGDLVVATPFLWQTLLRAIGALPPGLRGVTATAPTTPGLWHGLAVAGLTELTEIIGASETGGIGHRRSAGAPFTLSVRLAREGDRLIDRDTGATVVPQDRIEWCSERCFRPAGRRDGAVQVAGHNVFPARIAEVIAAHPMVAEAAVRPPRPGCGEALRAFVVLAEGHDQDAAEPALRSHIAANLTPAERPGPIRFGAALPRTETGKPADWS